jgi:hypothetical protein
MFAAGTKSPDERCDSSSSEILLEISELLSMSCELGVLSLRFF